MPDLRQLNMDEEKESARLAATAEREGRGALGRSMRASAKAAMAAAPGTAPERREAVMQAIRNQLDTEQMAAEAVATGAARRGAVAGYRMHLLGAAEAHNEATSGTQVEAEVTPEDEREAARWPILGRMPEQWAATLAAQLRWEVEGALGVVAMGAVQDGELPDRLDEIEIQHGRRLRQLATDAFLAGAQAAAAEFRAHMVRLAR